MKPDFSKHHGLLPAIAQNASDGKVLMLAYMNELAWDKTVETGKAHYWSRSRQKLWLKGEESGHVQMVKEIYVDCDLDTILLKVEQIGKAACHTGYESCFYRRYREGRLEVIGQPIFDPKEVYKK
ncbi:phosphoribosyl-AMP cyclohydrolase [Desulforhabdus amnigena]|uniref:Phosphoribosyl-AMP cyclohydrolase n=1 Tax=Desulforhabdus amnigena TaxID=40218 RepID=A0A9W6FSA1_9BACT|nr:phosphoribosyl-AMP cyclohydrolase [Desulforhabdus amnigena]NLJ29350.1 phosphoribosyl-AMP cyclohydrolase [Deltaproteobacteria bacterium]GLI34382.1 phosphoribosyl-AMP cyclohydrolase [Desulforhabdus amnigena]